MLRQPETTTVPETTKAPETTTTPETTKPAETTKQEETFSREEALEQWLTPDTDYTIYGDVKLTDNGDDGTIVYDSNKQL